MNPTMGPSFGLIRPRIRATGTLRVSPFRIDLACPPGPRRLGGRPRRPDAGPGALRRTGR